MSHKKRIRFKQRSLTKEYDVNTVDVNTTSIQFSVGNLIHVLCYSSFAQYFLAYISHFKGRRTFYHGT